MLLQSQISQAVAQATNQLRLLQRHQSNNPAQDNTSTPKSALKGSHDIKSFGQHPLKLTSTPPSPPPPPSTQPQNHVISGGVSPPPTPIIPPTSNSFSSRPNLGQTQHPLLRQPPFTLPPNSLSHQS